MRLASEGGIPGSDVGIYRIEPSLSGGINSEPSVKNTGIVKRTIVSAAQAVLLAAHEIKGGGYKKAEKMVDGLKRVTPEDVLRVTGKYMRNFNFIVIGDPAKIDETLFTSQ